VAVPWQMHAAIIGIPPIPLDDDAVAFSVLQMNDIYEALPLNNGTRGGLARVATIRKWLQVQSPDVITVLSGDMLSPCALDGSVPKADRLDGRHMVSMMNTLGLDYATFGNHEFDLPKAALQRRISESRFEWISTNVKEAATGNPFPNVHRSKLINIKGCRVLLIGLTVDENLGDGDYADIVSSPDLPALVRSHLAAFQGRYDVLIALTHLPIEADIALAEGLPEISIILGGHDHEGWHVWRGPSNTHITKADANAGSVFIHRVTFGLRSRRVTVHRSWVPVDENIPEDPVVAAEAERWYAQSFRRFEALGLQPRRIVTALPGDLELDGRDKVLRQGPSVLGAMVCEMQYERAAAFDADFGFLNSGLIRIDDRMLGTVTEYDVIRMFPFPNVIAVIKIKGSLLAAAFRWGLSNRGSGMYSFPCGVTLDDVGRWVTAEGTILDGADREYVVATNSFLLWAPGSPLATSSEVHRLGDIGSYTANFIPFLKDRYGVVSAA